MDPVIRIDECRSPGDLARVRELFEEYQTAIGISLDFQGFAEELGSLPGAYAAPRGALLIAMEDGRPAGCIALRPLGGGEAEIKRLYVRPTWRGTGLAARLVEAVSERARAAGYQALRLDTLASMEAAMRLYARLGFVETLAYHQATQPGMRFFRRTLEPLPG